MSRAWLVGVAAVGLALIGAVSCHPALAQDVAAPAQGASVATGTATAAEESAVEARMADIDKALAELAKQQEELAKQKKDLEALKAQVAGLKQGGAAAAPAAKVEDKRYKYSGYAQIHFESTDAGQGISQFIVRRFYNSLDYDFDDKTEGHLLVNTASTVTFLEGYIQNKKGRIQARAGQFIPPISFELYRSSSVRRVHDYSRIYTYIFGPNHRDLGVQVATRTDNPHAGRFIAAVMNGNRLNTPDNNSTKDVHLMYIQPFAEGKGKLNVAFINGNFTTAPATGTPVTTPKRLLNVGAAWANNRWDFQSEVMTGEALGAHQLSFYGDAAYIAGRHTIYGRYQYHDPDTATLGNLMSGPVIGYEYAIGPKSKVSVEADLYNDQATPGRDRRFAVRWQARW